MTETGVWEDEYEANAKACCGVRCPDSVLNNDGVVWFCGEAYGTGLIYQVGFVL